MGGFFTQRDTFSERAGGLSKLYVLLRFCMPHGKDAATKMAPNKANEKQLKSSSYECHLSNDPVLFWRTGAATTSSNPCISPVLGYQSRRCLDPGLLQRPRMFCYAER